jgi:protein-S-isoprenylcysteine O-methyltransferase Ste14
MENALYIGLYFICWALLHSLLASLRVKRFAGRLFGDGARRWYRLGFVITAVLTLIPLVILLVRLPDTRLYSVASPWRWLMAAGQVAALTLMAWTIRSTDPLDFIGVKHIVGRQPRYRTTLITHGLYRYTRHPMYFTGLLVMWLTPEMGLNLLSLFSLMSLYFILGSYHEEKLLIKQFGTAYLEYRKKVPRIFPGLPFPP